MTVSHVHVQSELGLLVSRLGRVWRRRADQALSAHGLSEAMSTPLLILSRGGKRVRQGELASEMGIEGPSLVRLIDLRLELPLPTGQTLYAESGLSLVVRYPVALRQVAAMDQAVSQRVQEAMLRDPKLRQAISGNPEIRAAVKT